MKLGVHTVIVSRQKPPVMAERPGELREDVSAHGWAIGPTSDAYFNRDAGGHELLERQARRHQSQTDLDDLSKNTKELKSSIDRLDHTFEHYPTSWWEEHQAIYEASQLQIQAGGKDNEESFQAE